MTHFISIQIGFHLHWYRRQRVVVTIQVKSNESFFNHSVCDITDSMSNKTSK